MKRPALLSLATLLAITPAAWSPEAAAQVGGVGFAATVIDFAGVVELSGPGIQPQSKVTGKEQLNVAAQLVARSKNASVLLQCANGGSLLLTGPFDASIIRGKDECAIDLGNGDAFATSNPEAGDKGQASIHDKVGLTDAQSGHTQFGVSVRRGDPGATEVFVIEGDATVSRAGEARKVSTGQMFTVKNAAIVPVSDARYSSLATNLARIDLRRAGVAANPETENGLKSSYELALRKPDNADARKALTNQYKMLKIPESPITRYNRFRIGEISHLAPGVTKQPAPPAGVHIAESAAATAAPPSGAFTNPKLGDYRVDLCLHDARECGAPAANAFCQQNGFSRAASFKEDHDVGAQQPTLILGDKKLCRSASCDAFASIQCE